MIVIPSRIIFLHLLKCIGPFSFFQASLTVLNQLLFRSVELAAICQMVFYLSGLTCAV